MTANDVRTRRKALGYTQKQFSEILGIAYATYTNWEQGRSLPPPYFSYVFDWLEYLQRSAA